MCDDDTASKNVALSQKPPGAYQTKAHHWTEKITLVISKHARMGTSLSAGLKIADVAAWAANLTPQETSTERGFYTYAQETADS